MLKLEPFITEEIVPGLARRSSADRRLVMFIVSDYAHIVIDRWLTELASTVETWPPGSSVQVLNRFTKTPLPRNAMYLQKHVTVFIRRSFGETHGRIAFCLEGGFLFNVTHVIAMMMKGDLPHGSRIEVDVFNAYEDGLSWVIAAKQPDHVEA